MQLLPNPCVKDAASSATGTLSTNQKSLKILLYGNIQGAQYRSQSLIKFLLDSRYPISLVCPNIYLKKGIKKTSFLNKALSRIHLIELFIKAAFVDVIYVLPLNNNIVNNAIWMSKIFRKKLITEVHVSLYETLLEEDIEHREREQKSKLERYRDKLSLTKPDYIITVCKHETHHWRSNLGLNSLDEDKVFVAPLFSSSTLMPKRDFVQKGVLRICWWGTFIPLHGLDNILQALKLLKKERIKFVCNLFGISSSSFNVYAEKIQLLQLNSLVYLRKDLTFFDDSLPKYLVENCDLALGVFGNTRKAHNSVPTKVVEALSMGIPTLTMNSPALTEFFNTQTDLWTCEPSPQSIAEMIIKIIDGTVHSVDWVQTRKKALNTFSITQYQTVVSEILGKIADGAC